MPQRDIGVRHTPFLSLWRSIQTQVLKEKTDKMLQLIVLVNEQTFLICSQDFRCQCTLLPQNCKCRCNFTCCLHRPVKSSAGSHLRLEWAREHRKHHELWILSCNCGYSVPFETKTVLKTCCLIHTDQLLWEEIRFSPFPPEHTPGAVRRADVPSAFCCPQKGGPWYPALHASPANTICTTRAAGEHRAAVLTHTRWGPWAHATQGPLRVPVAGCSAAQIRRGSLLLNAALAKPSAELSYQSPSHGGWHSPAEYLCGAGSARSARAAQSCSIRERPTGSVHCVAGQVLLTAFQMATLRTIHSYCGTSWQRH